MAPDPAATPRQNVDPKDKPRIYGPFGLFRDPRLEFLSVTRLLAYAFSAVVMLFLAALVLSLLLGSLPIFREQGFWSFATKPEWNYRRQLFGAASMLYGTLVTSFVALLLAGPLGILSATFISEYLSGPLQSLIKQSVELLAAVPSVVYGLLGVITLRPLVHKGLGFLGAETGDTLLTGSLLLAIMILPTIMTLADDALRAVPKATREAAMALGLTRRESIWTVVWPRARSGLISAVLLGLGRALGETIAVFLVIGRSDSRLPKPLWDLSALLAPGQTLTSKLGSPELAISYSDPQHWSAILGLAFLLLVTVAVIMGLGLSLRRRPV